MMKSKQSVITFSTGESFLATDIEAAGDTVKGKILNNHDYEFLLYIESKRELWLIPANGEVKAIENSILLGVTEVAENPFR